MTAIQGLKLDRATNTYVAWDYVNNRPAEALPVDDLQQEELLLELKSAHIKRGPQSDVLELNNSGPETLTAEKPLIIRIREPKQAKAQPQPRTPVIAPALSKAGKLLQAGAKAAAGLTMDTATFTAPYAKRASNRMAKEVGVRTLQLRQWRKQLPLHMYVVASLGGAAVILMQSQLVEAPSPVTGVQVVDSAGHVVNLPPLDLPKSEAEINEAFKSINKVRFAPGGPEQQRKIANLTAAEKQLAKLDAEIAKASAAISETQKVAQDEAAKEKHLKAQQSKLASLQAQHHAKEKQLAALPLPRFNDKMLIMNGSAAAVVLTPRTAFIGPMKNIAPDELFGRLVGHGKIESTLIGNIAYSERLNGATGFVQLLPTSYLPLYAKHHDKIVLPRGEQSIFDRLTRTVNTMISAYVDKHPEVSVIKNKDGSTRSLSREQAIQRVTANPNLIRLAYIELGPSENIIVNTYAAHHPELSTSVDKNGHKRMLSRDQVVKKIRDDSNLLRAAFNEVSPAQALIRNALRDPTPMTALGRPTTRGIFLSAVLYQFYQDEAPSLPADIVVKYGPEVPSYNRWQIGLGGANTFFKHYRILQTWDKNDPRMAAAANHVQAAREAVRKDDARLAQLHQQLQAAHPKPPIVRKAKPTPVKGIIRPTKTAPKLAVKVAPKAAAKPAPKAVRAAIRPIAIKQARQVPAKPAVRVVARPIIRRPVLLTAREKQLMAQIGGVERHRAQMLKELQKWQATYSKLHAPWDNYVRDMLNLNAKDNAGIWFDHGQMKKPEDVELSIKKDKLGDIPAVAKLYAQVGVLPWLKYGTAPDVIARMPTLKEVRGKLVYVASPGSESAVAQRPNSVRVGFNITPRPAG